jgi:hypothetical protein
MYTSCVPSRMRCFPSSRLDEPAMLMMVQWHTEAREGSSGYQVDVLVMEPSGRGGPGAPAIKRSGFSILHDRIGWSRKQDSSRGLQNEGYAAWKDTNGIPMIIQQLRYA